MARAILYRIGFLGVVFITNILIANLCHPANFGIISLLTVNGAILSLLIGAGLDSVVVYSVSHQKWTLSQSVYLVNRASILQTLIFVALAALFLLLSGRTLLSGSGRPFFWPEIIYFAGLIFRERFQSLFYARHKALQVNACLLAVSGLFLVGLYILSLYNRLSFSALFAFFCAQNLVQGLALVVLSRLGTERLSGKKLEWNQLASAFRLCLLVLVTNIVQTVAYRIDYLFINHFHTSYDVGLYSQANKFANLIWIVPNVVATILIPKMVGITKENLRLVMRIGVVTNVLVSVATVLIAYFFYNYILVQQYRPGFITLLLMLPGYLFWSFVIYYAAFFASKGVFKTNLRGSILCFSAIIICDSLLIPKYNYNGAAVANSIAYTISFGYYLFCFLRYSRLTLAEMSRLSASDLRAARSFMSV